MRVSITNRTVRATRQRHIDLLDLKGVSDGLTVLVEVGFQLAPLKAKQRKGFGKTYC